MSNNNTQQLKDLYDKLGEIIKQSEQPELVSGEWYIGNEPVYGDWLFKYKKTDGDSIYNPLTYYLRDMWKSENGLTTFDSARPLTPEERVKYADLIRNEWPSPERVKGGGIK